MSLRTIVYVDGLNFYYRCDLQYEKNRKCRWLDFKSLVRGLLNDKEHEFVKFKYFTSLVKGPACTEQKKYLNALRELKNFEIIEGRFGKKDKKIKFYLPDGEIQCKGTAWEEKESDVNIAVHIVSDAYENKYDCIVLISNDTDLKSALSCVKRLKKKIIILTPGKKETHIELKKSSDYHKKINICDLKSCLLPEKIQVANSKKVIACPKKWR